MTASHVVSPVQLDVVSPPHFDRIQILLRLLIGAVLGAFGFSAGWVAWALYGLLPLIAAISISTDGAEVYASRVGPALWRVLRWLFELEAYLMLATDRFPTADGDSVRIELQLTAKPTIGSALARLLTSIPSVLVLCVLSFVSGILTVVAMVLVLVGAAMPAWLLSYQRGVLRWQARLAAYHASLVDEYPPFAFETNGGGAGAVGSTATAH